MREHVGLGECSAAESKNKAANQAPMNSGEVLRFVTSSSLGGLDSYPSVSFLAIFNDDSRPSAIGEPTNTVAIGEPTNTVDKGDPKGSHSLRFYVDHSAWDVTHEELMDWCDTS